MTNVIPLRQLASARLPRRRFIAASAAVMGGPLWATVPQRPARGSYKALLVGRDATTATAAGVWACKPAIKLLRVAEDASDASRQITALAPDLLMLGELATAPELLEQAGKRGLRGVLLNLAAAPEHVLVECQQISELYGIQTTLVDPLRYEPAAAMLAEQVASDEIGRLLEIRCAVQGGSALPPQLACRQAMAAAVRWGGSPRSCYGRIYHNTQPVDFQRAQRLKNFPGLEPGVSLHASLSLACGVSFQLDWYGSRSSERAAVEFSVVGSRGAMQLSYGTQPTLRWRAAAVPDLGSGNAGWRTLSPRATEESGENLEASIAQAAVGDLLDGLEGRSPPLAQLAAACTADSLLRSAFDSHCQQQHIHLSNGPPGPSTPTY